MTADAHQPVVMAGAALAEAAGAVILVHGRGGSAEDILGLVEEFGHGNPAFTGAAERLAYLAPQAAGNSWYPYSFLAPIEQNEPWLTSALGQLRDIVEGIAGAGIAADKIVLAGFSQGACLASEFVARNAQRYGGLIAFSGGLIGPPGTQFQYTGKLAGMPAFFGGADPDPHVPWQRVEESAAAMSGLGAEVTVRRYPGMPHTIVRDEIVEARRLLDKLVTNEISLR